MANIPDSAGIFTGATLDAFTAMETLVLRDGDLVGAQEAMRKACIEVCQRITKLQANTSDGSVTTSRKEG